MEDKETRPPPRYNEGTLIDAMQNAWRFVGDDALRERLREARGIGTPATRAEVIRGLKAQEFLMASGKHIVPTGRGLALFGVLERADPALVGRQEMMGAIDAVCMQAQRIIGRLTSDAGEGLAPERGMAVAAALPRRASEQASQTGTRDSNGPGRQAGRQAEGIQQKDQGHGRVTGSAA